MLSTRGDVVSVTIMDFLLRTAPVKKDGFGQRRLWGEQKE